MTHDDHVDLLRVGVDATGGPWADLGSGTGAFTLALAELIDSRAEIYSVDRDRGALDRQRAAMRVRYPAARVTYMVADLADPIDLPPLDGLVMANALHFFRDRERVVRALAGHLRPGGRFILVEYDTDVGNPWVPYPLSFATWERLAPRCGLVGVRLGGSRPSRFLGRIYAAVAERSHPKAGD